MKIRYDYFKYSFYFIGLIWASYFLFQGDFIDATHTAPMSFIISLFCFLIGAIWGIIDSAINYFSKKKSINLKSHYIGVTIHSMILFGIIVFTFVNYNF